MKLKPMPDISTSKEETTAIRDQRPSHGNITPGIGTPRPMLHHPKEFPHIVLRKG